MLGDSYANIASFGLSFQRSQNGGRYVPVAGPNYSYYTRTASRVTAPEKETSIFDGIDTTYAGLFKMLGRTAPAGVDSALAGIDAAVARAISGFQVHRSGVRRAGACGRPEAHARRHGEIRERTRRAARTAHQGTPIPGSDQRRARTGVVGDGRCQPKPGSDRRRTGRWSRRRLDDDGAHSRSDLRREHTSHQSRHHAHPAPKPQCCHHARVYGDACQRRGCHRSASSNRATFFFTVKWRTTHRSARSRTSAAPAFTENRYTLSDPSSFGRPFNPPPFVAVARITA